MSNPSQNLAPPADPWGSRIRYDGHHPDELHYNPGGAYDHAGAADSSIGFIDYGDGNTSTAKGRARATTILAAEMPSFPDSHGPEHTSHMLTLRLGSAHPREPHFALHDTARYHGYMDATPTPPLPTQQFPRTAETTVIPMPRSHRREGMRTKLSRLILHGGYRGRHAAR